MKQPIVSVIIPVHNEEKYIGRCIRSVLNQTLKEDSFETIVINDASEDRTEYALQVFGPEVRVLRNDRRMGLPASLNKGIRAARGQFIIRLDGDDFISSEYLNLLLLFLRLNPYMDAVACDYLVVDNLENVIARKNCMEDPLGCGIMFRLEQLIDIGLYDEEFLLHEDKDLRIRFTKKYKIHRLELPLYRYRKHGENMTNNTAAMEQYYQFLEAKHGEIQL